MIMVSEEAVEEVADLLRSKADELSDKTVLFNSRRMHNAGKEEAYKDAADIVEENLLD